MNSGVYVGRNGVIDGKLRLMVVDSGCKDDCAATYLNEDEAIKLISELLKAFSRQCYIVPKNMKGTGGLTYDR